MFEKIRRPGRSRKEGQFKKIFSYFVFGLICVVFLFIAPMGPQLIGGGVVAKVGRQNVKIRELRIIEENLKERSASQFNPESEEESLRYQQRIRSQAIDRLIHLYLMNVSAQREGFFVTDQELRDNIQSFPVFQEKGRFLYSRYLTYLKMNRLNPSHFENWIRKVVLEENWRSLFEKSAISNQLEENKRKERYKYKVNFRYALLKAGDTEKENQLADIVKSQDKKRLRAFLKSAGLSWETTGVFSLGLPMGVPIAQNEKIVSALISQLPKRGLIPKLVRSKNQIYVLDILSFSQAEMSPEEKKMEMLFIRGGFEKSIQLLDAWLNEKRKEIPIKKNKEFLSVRQ